MLGRKSPSLRHAAVVAGLLLSCCLFGFAQSRMTVRREVHRDVSPPLCEMIKVTPRPSRFKQEAEPVRRIPLPPGLGAGQYGFSVTSAPPDTNGTVGATQYVQWVNTSFAVFNKATGALIAGPTAGNTLWAGFGGGCQTNKKKSSRSR